MACATLIVDCRLSGPCKSLHSHIFCVSPVSQDLPLSHWPHWRFRWHCCVLLSSISRTASPTGSSSGFFHREGPCACECRPEPFKTGHPKSTDILKCIKFLNRPPIGCNIQNIRNLEKWPSQPSLSIHMDLDIVAVFQFFADSNGDQVLGDELEFYAKLQFAAKNSQPWTCFAKMAMSCPGVSRLECINPKNQERSHRLILLLENLRQGGEMAWRWLGLGNSWALRHRGFNKAVLFEDFEASSLFWIHLVAGFNQMRLLDIKLGAETSAPRPVDDARRGP